ncbi:hypothetical protein ACPA9J_27370 [Pseudomonas aeruginosa]
MGGEWQWLGRLPEERNGDETHWHPSGALLLDALLQALAVAEPERAFALVELRLSVPRFSRCGPLASRLTLSLSDKASITLALRGEHDHEWRDVLQRRAVGVRLPGCRSARTVPGGPRPGRSRPGCGRARGGTRRPVRQLSLSSTRDAARRHFAAGGNPRALRRRPCRSVVGFARVQVLDDLPEHVRCGFPAPNWGACNRCTRSTRMAAWWPCSKGRCCWRTNQSNWRLADEPRQPPSWSLAGRTFRMSRWYGKAASGGFCFLVEPACRAWFRHSRRAGWASARCPGGTSRTARSGWPRLRSIRPVRACSCPAAVTATSSVSLTFCSPWGEAVATCPTGKPIWFLHPPARRADAAAARRLGMLYGATRALALEQPAWWGGVVELDPADGRGLHRFARLLVGVPRHDHLKIRGTRSLRPVSGGPTGRVAPNR